MTDDAGLAAGRRLGQRSWPRIAVEIIAVVASILMAFGIDAWWDVNQARLDEEVALGALRSEFLQNRSSLVERIELNRMGMARVRDFLRASPDELRSTGPDILVDFANDLWAPLTFDPALGATSGYLTQGVVVTEQGELVRRAVTDWERSFLDAGEEAAALWGASHAALAALATHVAQVSPNEGETAGILSLVRVEPVETLLAAQRDDQLRGLSITKVTLQNIYTRELSDLLVLTDSVLAVLGVEIETLPPRP